MLCSLRGVVHVMVARSTEHVRVTGGVRVVVIHPACEGVTLTGHVR